MPSLPHSLSVLREREYRLLFGGQLVSVLGDQMVNVALAFGVIGIGGSASDLGLVFAARAFALVASLLVGGVVADRLPRRTVLIGADVVRLASQGALAAAFILGTPPVALVAALAAITGAATGFFNPASTGFLVSVVSPAGLQQANALRGVSSSGGRIAGPVLSAALVATVGAGWALAVDAGTFAVSAAVLSRMRSGRERFAREASTSFVTDFREGWDAFRSRRWLWSFVAFFAYGNLLYGALQVIGPLVAERDLGGAPAWGAIIGASGVGGLIGGVVALGAVVAELGLMLSVTLWESTLQRHVAPEVLSRVSAYDWFGSMALTPVGLALWGPIAAALGYGNALWLAFGLNLLGVAAILGVPEVRRLPPAPVGGTATAGVRAAGAA